MNKGNLLNLRNSKIFFGLYIFTLITSCSIFNRNDKKEENRNPITLTPVERSPECEQHFKYYKLSNKINEILPSQSELPMPEENGGYAGYCYSANEGLSGIRTETFEVPPVSQDTCVTSPVDFTSYGFTVGAGNNDCFQNTDSEMVKYTWLEIDPVSHNIKRIEPNGYLWLSSKFRYQLEIKTDFDANPNYIHCNWRSGLIMISQPSPETIVYCPNH